MNHQELAYIENIMEEKNNEGVVCFKSTRRRQ